MFRRIWEDRAAHAFWAFVITFWVFVFYLAVAFAVWSEQEIKSLKLDNFTCKCVISGLDQAECLEKWREENV